MNSQLAPFVESLRTQVRHSTSVQRVGVVTGVAGLIIESEGPNVGLKDQCIIRSHRTNFSVRAEVVGDRAGPCDALDDDGSARSHLAEAEAVPVVAEHGRSNLFRG